MTDRVFESWRQPYDASEVSISCHLRTAISRKPSKTLKRTRQIILEHDDEGYALPTPPVVSGLPLLGHLLDYARDPVALFRRGYEAHGPVFSIRLGPRHAVVLLGPEHHAFFFNETDSALSLSKTFKWVIPILGDKFPLAAEVSTYERHLPIYALPFHSKHMPGYLEAMTAEVTAWLDTLGKEGRFDLTATFEDLIMQISARAVLGYEIRERMGYRLRKLFKDLARGASSHFTRKVSGPLFGGIRRRAKRTLHEAIYQVLSERRARRGGHVDFLQVLLDAQEAYKDRLTDELIAELLLGFIFAGHPTTAGHAMWALILLLQHPVYLRRVLDELDSELEDGGSIDLNALSTFIRLEWALKETERLRPAVLVMGRYNDQAYTRSGYHVPKGWLTLISPPVSHRLPDVFPEPDTYDPERFSPARSEDRKTPFSLIGFGGGLHHCIGKRFAFTETKAILSLLLQRYALELVEPDPKPTPGPHISHPRGPVWITYRRR